MGPISKGYRHHVPYWYPTQLRVEELSRELADLDTQVATSFAANPLEYVSLVSTALLNAKNTIGFPARQIPQWLWVASQFRLHGAEQSEVAAASRSALTFLIMRLARSNLTEADVQDLNWVLDFTIQKLGAMIGGKNLRSCLSAEEVFRIEKRLESYQKSSAFDAQILRQRIAGQLENLKALAADGNLPTIIHKVETLFGSSAKIGREGAIARAALLYLADIPDVGPDTQKFLGLLDDVYVIESAYAAIETQTRYLPLLDAFLERWPFVADLPLVGTGPSPLDRYSQYVACICLHILFETTEHSLLVLRESAAHCILSALMAAVESMRREAKTANLDIVRWSAGQPITISDGSQTFRALYGGVMNVGQLRKHRIGVRNQGWITVDERILPYIARAETAHTRLSTGNEILQWLKDAHPDPLVYLTGSSRRRLTQQECILLLGPRYKIDEYLDCIRPLNHSVAALFGIRYVMGHNRFDDLSESVTETPCIYACSDANVALDLIRDPPEHVKSWRVIVDGARNGRAMLAGAPSATALVSTSLCIFAELHEREASYDIAKQNLPVLYLEDQHVEAPPLEIIFPTSDDDALIRLLCRQRNHWVASRTIYDLKNEVLEEISECMKERISSNNDSETTALDLLLSEFLQRAISHPIMTEGADGIYAARRN